MTGATYDHTAYKVMLGKPAKKASEPFKARQIWDRGRGLACHWLEGTRSRKRRCSEDSGPQITLLWLGRV